MDSAGAGAHWACRLRYAENRPYTVGETLEELAGPAAGVVVLPTVLDWTPKRVYDLSDDVDLRMLYETVIREAMHAGELRTFLDPVLLSAMWQRLWGLPRARFVWEGRFPQLARRAA
ncbi:hypothetical protein [Streptomyces sp. ME18-1-4]|uniref:hypothetical protein n=1 Tax=Streptomyces sp. ME18-1-4 TaxID=3028685 RepID=UPI0029BD5083|nr:hypothetical protein [Streptomyces sp. ME18-1-4]MDX3243099.1 hypothetical protein [Streptomyces sp. ME18-1-4]